MMEGRGIRWFFSRKTNRRISLQFTTGKDTTTLSPICADRLDVRISVCWCLVVYTVRAQTIHTSNKVSVKRYAMQVR